jgi:MFS family permease
MRSRFVVFSLGQAISTFGNGMAPVALAFTMLGIGGSASDLGLALAAREIVGAAVGLLAGVAADRWLHRTTIGLGSGICAASQGAAAWAVLDHQASPLLLTGLAAVNGVGAAFLSPAVFGALPRLLTESSRRRDLSLFRLSTTLAVAVGSAAGGLTVERANAGIALAIDAASFVVGGTLLCAAAGRARSSSPENPRRWLDDLRLGYEALRTQTWAWRVIVAASLSNACGSGALSVLGPVVAQETPGFGPAGWGVVLAAVPIGAILGGLVSLRFPRRRPLRVVTGLLVVQALPVLALMVHPTSATVALTILVSSAVTELHTVVWMHSIQQAFSDDVLARVWSWDETVSGGLQPFVQIVVGPVTAIVGRTPVLGLAAMVMIATVPYQLRDADLRTR